MTISNQGEFPPEPLSENYSTEAGAQKVRSELNPEEFRLLSFSVSPKRVLIGLSVCILTLILLSTTGQFARLYIFHNKRFNHLFNLFHLDSEANIPTVYSSLTLLLCAILLAVIAILKGRRRDRFTLHWRGLSCIFAFLALDEAAEIHELLTEPVRRILHAGGFFYFAWIIPAVIVLAIIGLTYFKFIKSLPPRTKFLIVLSAAVYISAVILIEALGGNHVEAYGYENMRYVMITTLEEACEMFGVALFIYTLLEYIREQFQFLQIHWHFTHQSRNTNSRNTNSI